MRKIKTSRKLFVWVALFVFMLGCNSERVLAAETNQNGVIVETTFDKSSYQSEEKIIYSVYIQNTNSEIINIKDINFDIPDGYKLSEETTNESIQNIQPGEHVLLKYYIDEKTTNSGSGNDDSNTKDDNSSNGDNKDNPSKGNNKGDSVSNNNKVTNKSETKQVGTGDNAKILLWIVIMIVALIIIFVIIFHTKNRKGLLSLLLIMSIFTEIIISPISVKAEDNPNIITLADKFVVKDVEKNINVHINYEKQSTDLEEDTTTYTRGEWIQEIVNAYGINVNLEDASETQFTDIENSQYRDSIRIAEIYGIIDTGESFFPDEGVTREFAAITTVRLLGYQGTGTPECNDLEDISQKEDVYLALKAGAFLLKDGYFKPKDMLNKEDHDYALKYIMEVVGLTENNPNKNTGYVYKDGVIKLNDDLEYVDDETYISLPRNKETEALHVGQIFVINDESAYKIKDIIEEKDSIKIEYENPELNEFISSISICGEAKDIDWSKVKLADGVTIEDSEDDVSSATYEDSEGIETYAGETVAPIPIPKNAKLKFSITDNYEVSVKFKGLTGKYAVDADLDAGRINNVYASIGFDSDVYLTPIKDKWEPDRIKEAKKVKLFEAPVVGPLWLGVYAVMEIDGSISFVTNWEYTYGFGIINNMPRLIFQADCKKCNLNANALASIGVKGELAVVIFKCTLINFELAPKINIKANANGYLSNPKSCVDVSSVYLSVDVAAFDDSVLYKLLGIKWSFTLWDQKISPFCWKGIHIEVSEIDGEPHYNIVKVCTRESNKYKLKFSIKDNLTQNPLKEAEIIIDDKKYLTEEDGITEEIIGQGNVIEVTIQKEGYISKQMTIIPSEYIDTPVIVNLTAIPEGAKEYNGHYYKIYYGAYPWNIAKEKCEEMGGYLVTITTKEEQQFINQLNTSNNRLWIGGTRNQQMLWNWVTDEVWMYDNWAPGEPNNSPNVVSNENCVAIWNSSGQWNDLNNDNTYEQSGYICEWE